MTGPNSGRNIHSDPDVEALPCSLERPDFALLADFRLALVALQRVQGFPREHHSGIRSCAPEGCRTDHYPSLCHGQCGQMVQFIERVRGDGIVRRGWSDYRIESRQWRFVLPVDRSGGN